MKNNEIREVGFLEEILRKTTGWLISRGYEAGVTNDMLDLVVEWWSWFQALIYKGLGMVVVDASKSKIYFWDLCEIKLQ